MCNSNNLGQFYALPTTVGYNGHDLRYKRNPMYSFGTRQKPHKPFGYATTLPLGTDRSNITRFGRQEAPKFSITGRHHVSDGSQNPGPIYLINDALTRQSSPKFSITGRTKQVSTDRSPGPIYAFKGDIGKSSAPAFSLSGRHAKLRKSKMPSPAQYAAPNLDACKPSAPKASMKFRHKGITSHTKTPGPNIYFPQPTSSAKAYSFGLRHHPCSGRILTPEDNK
ncbi:outer dense fiber protein 3-B [Phlebotomus papatasi]|uniref:outer dense fiber protein 3-B n=1 Tax=Phlebotomus papatasi TaxID=29031 RepID=UPI0024833A66|nr:outer dense fiber protein 3-B [Phlebotomus papatasi]